MHPYQPALYRYRVVLLQPELVCHAFSKFASPCTRPMHEVWRSARAINQAFHSSPRLPFCWRVLVRKVDIQTADMNGILLRDKINFHSKNRDGWVESR